MLRQIRQSVAHAPQTLLGDCIGAAALFVILIVGLHLPMIA